MDNLDTACKLLKEGNFKEWYFVPMGCTLPDGWEENYIAHELKIEPGEVIHFHGNG